MGVDWECLGAPALACFFGSPGSDVGVRGLVCLEHSVVSWVHEIDPLVGWRAWGRAPALGAWVYPPGSGWETHPTQTHTAYSTPVTQAEAKHRLTKHPLPHPQTSPLFSLCGAPLPSPGPG